MGHEAHAKNYSILHDQSGVIRLAPLYDVMSTLVYGDDYLVMYVGNVRRTQRVTTQGIINEGMSWGLAQSLAPETVHNLLEAIDEASALAAGETDHLPELILRFVNGQC